MNGDTEKMISSVSQSDHDLLVRIDEKIIFISHQIVEDKIQLLKLISDITIRISKLEDDSDKFKTMVANMTGKITVIGAVWAFVVSIAVTVGLRLIFK